jgi:hypothetical protein
MAVEKSYGGQAQIRLNSEEKLDTQILERNAF